MSKIGKGFLAALTLTTLGFSGNALAYKAYALGDHQALGIGGTVYAIDTDTNAIVGTVATDFGSANIAITPNGKSLYVGNSSTLQVIDTASLSVVKTFTSLHSSGQIAVSKDSATAYAQDIQNIYLLDTARNTIKTTISGAWPSGIILSPDGNNGYIVGRWSVPSIAVLDIKTNHVWGAFYGFNDPKAGPSDNHPKSIMAITPNGTKLFVANIYISTVSVFTISDSSLIESASIDVDSYPTSLLISPDGTKLYVANAGSNQADNGTVSVIDTASNSMRQTIPLHAELGGIAITPDGAKLYVTSLSNATVFVIDTASNTVAATIDVPYKYSHLVDMAIASGSSGSPVQSQDCLFNWAEANYPGLFSPAGASDQLLPPYRYRYYRNTNSYVGVSSANNHVYYIGPDGNLQDVGDLSGWLATANCQ